MQASFAADDQALEYEGVLRCPVCGASRDSMTTFLPNVGDLERPQDHYQLLKCANCGLGLTEPVPTRATLGKLYSGGDSSDYEFPALGVIGRIKDKLAVGRVLAITREARVLPKRVLDYGTGAGRYAAAARSAFPAASVTGTDFATSPPPHSYFELDPKLRYVGYAELRESRASFDLILARHVLEHVHDPLAMIREWLALLEPSGVLYIEVPNLNSRLARLVGPRWPLWYVPKHLSHFARPTLRRTIEAAGGRPVFGCCEMPLMGNILAILTGHSRFDPRFRVPGILLHPVQLAIAAASGEGTCLYALVRL